MCNEIVGVNGDEGTPVPIPNTVVKLVYGDNTWLATAREDNSTPTFKQQRKLLLFLLHKNVDKKAMQCYNIFVRIHNANLERRNEIR